MPAPVPYYQEDGITIYCADNLVILPYLQILLNGEKVDSIITDPPYGTASETKAVKRGSGDGYVDNFNIEWDREFPVAWIQFAVEALKPGGSFAVFTDNIKVGDVWKHFQARGTNPLQTVYWHKPNFMPQPRQNFCSSVESLVFGRKEGKILYWGGGGATPNFMSFPSVSEGKITSDTELHPTRKSVRVMEWIINKIAAPNSLVLDPFLGSGTTAVACKLLGRRCVAIEREEKWCRVAVERLRQGVLTMEMV